MSKQCIVSTGLLYFHSISSPYITTHYTMSLIPHAKDLRKIGETKSIKNRPQQIGSNSKHWLYIIFLSICPFLCGPALNYPHDTKHGNKMSKVHTDKYNCAIQQQSQGLLPISRWHTTLTRSRAHKTIKNVNNTTFLSFEPNRVLFWCLKSRS